MKSFDQLQQSKQKAFIEQCGTCIDLRYEPKFIIYLYAIGDQFVEAYFHYQHGFVQARKATGNSLKCYNAPHAAPLQRIPTIAAVRKNGRLKQLWNAIRSLVGTRQPRPHACEPLTADDPEKTPVAGAYTAPLRTSQQVISITKATTRNADHRKPPAKYLEYLLR